MRGSWLTTLRNFFFPIFCRECGAELRTEENGFFCPTCWERPRRVTAPYCIRCGIPFEGRVGFGALPNTPCSRCSDWPDDGCEIIRAACVYESTIAEAIKLFKFEGRRRVALPLIDDLRAFVSEHVHKERYDLLVPVPLYPVRERERGYNQSELLATMLLDEFPKVQLFSALRKVRPTPVQSRTSNFRERRRNMRAAFAVDTTIDLKDRTILLIDDVVTSGATVHECARTLRLAGAARVDALAVAVAISKYDGVKSRSATVERREVSI